MAANVASMLGADEGVGARDQLIQQNAERENVGSAIRRLTADLFRRHIRRRARRTSSVAAVHDGRRLVDGVGVRQARRQPEVHDLDVPVFGEHHVRRLEVAVNDTPLVRGVERLGDLFRHAQGLTEPQRPAAQPPFERLAADVFHRDAGATVERRDFVNRADERMIERGGGARLAEQLLQAVGLVRAR